MYRGPSLHARGAQAANRVTSFLAVGLDGLRCRQMTGELRTVGDDGPERCSFCGAEAAGPCASCYRSVCGDCCTLTEGGANVWAICLDCDRKGARSLTRAWWSFGMWLFGLLLLLAAVVALLEVVSGKHAR